MLLIKEVVCLAFVLAISLVETDGKITIGQTMVGQCHLADIAFVVDGSGSIGFVNWMKMMHFLDNIVSRFQVGPDDVQFGCVKFNSYAQVEFDLGQHTSEKALNTAIDSISYTGGNTNMAAGLRMARTGIFTSDKDRPVARNIIILIADGSHNIDMHRTIPEAYLLKQSGAYIISVGVTRSINRNVMKAISSNNDVISVDSFDKLDDIVDDIASTACKPTGPPCVDGCSRNCGIGHPVVNCVIDIHGTPCCNKPCPATGKPGGNPGGNPGKPGPICRDYLPYKNIAP